MFEDLSYNVIIGRDFFLCQSLSMFVAKDQKDWDEFLRLILFAHRTYNLEAIGDTFLCSLWSQGAATNRCQIVASNGRRRNDVSF